MVVVLIFLYILLHCVVYLFIYFYIIYINCVYLSGNFIINCIYFIYIKIISAILKKKKNLCNRDESLNSYKLDFFFFFFHHNTFPPLTKYKLEKLKSLLSFYFCILQLKGLLGQSLTKSINKKLCKM